MSIFGPLKNVFGSDLSANWSRLEIVDKYFSRCAEIKKPLSFTLQRADSLIRIA